MIKKFEQYNNEEEWYEYEDEIDVYEWEKLYKEITEQGFKVLMYNPKTGDSKLTQMKLDNKRFNKEFAGYIPICSIHGYRATIGNRFNVKV